MMRRFLVLSGLVASVSVTDLSGQDRWERQVIEELAEVGDFLDRQGYVLTHEVQTGALAEAGEAVVWVELIPGRQYAVLGVCESACVNIDLELFDAQGNSVDADYQFDDAPLVRVEPDSTNRYRVRVVLTRCDADVCSYGVGVYGRVADAGIMWERQVVRQVNEVTAQLQGNGYEETHEPRLGRLAQLESTEFQLRLLRGMTYSIVGVCDEDCSDLHLTISDPDGEELDFDPVSGNYPVLAVRPARSGRYRVLVTMAVCSAEPCYYGIGVYGLSPAPTSYRPNRHFPQGW